MHDPRAKASLRMIRPTDSLKNEHGLIVRAMQVLGGIGRAVKAGVPFPAADCAVAIRFLREFVLASHMHWEATVLCPAVAMRGDDPVAVVVGDVLRLHAEIGDLIQTLMWFWEPGDLSLPERDGFAAAVTALDQRFQQLRVIEEGRLFPVAEAVVPADDRLEWGRWFAEERARGVCMQWQSLLARLATVWTS